MPAMNVESVSNWDPIIKMRWLTENKATLHDLTDKYGVSVERIRQLKANAMRGAMLA